MPASYPCTPHRPPSPCGGSRDSSFSFSSFLGASDAADDGSVSGRLGVVVRAGRAVSQTATLARLSHVVQRLETRGLLERFPCPDDRRATNARLTDAGWQRVRDSAPGHLATVHATVIDALSPEQVVQLGEISEAILHRLDPDGAKAAIYERYDSPPAQHPQA